MAPFQFRLEQVRQYRKQLEEQAMQALAVAVQARDATLARIDSISLEIENVRTLLCKPEALESARLWLGSQYETAMKQDLENARSLLARQENHVDACRVALVEAAKDRELLDRLKEKQAEKHHLQERQKEQRTNDETATLRYTPAAI